MSNSKIKCEACGTDCHVIKAHLRDAHGTDSDQPMTIEEYTAAFPGAPLMSEAAKASMAKRREEQGGKQGSQKDTKAEPQHRKAKPGEAVTAEGWNGEGPEPTYIRRPLFQQFGLPKTKTVGANGKPIEITVSAREDSPDRVPPYEDYIPDMDALRNVLMALEFNEPIMVWGHAGIGKTSIFRYVCRNTNRRLVRMQHTAETQEHKILGQVQVKKGFDDTGKAYSYTEFELGDLPLAMKNGWVYLADEIDRAQPEVLSAYQSVLEGQPLHLPEAGEEDRLIIPHPDFRFVATGNSNGMGDETGIHRAVQRQDAATFERFSIVMQMDYLDKEDEVQMLMEKAEVSRKHAEKLWDFASKVRSQFPHDFPLTIGPRVLIKIGRLGRLKGQFVQGVQLAYANRLPETERKSALDLAARILS